MAIRLKRPEEAIHLQCTEYLFKAYPKIFWCHIANERMLPKTKMGFAMGAKFKKLGVVPGMPDLMIFTQRAVTENIFGKRELTVVNGLAIELKAPGNKPTDKQIHCLTELKGCGWVSTVVYDFDTFRNLVDTYMNRKLEIDVTKPIIDYESTT